MFSSVFGSIALRLHVPWRSRTGWAVSRTHRREDSGPPGCRWGATPPPPPWAPAPAAVTFSHSPLSLSSSAPLQLDVLQFPSSSEVVEQTNGRTYGSDGLSTQTTDSLSAHNQRPYLNLRFDAPEPEDPGWQLRQQEGLG